MSGGRKNDPHVPLGPARRLVPRLFERHAFFDIGGYIRPSEKPKSSGRTTKMRETLCCMLSQSRFRARRRFFHFFRMRFSAIRKRPRNKKQLPPRVLWRPPSSLAYTLRLAQRRHAEIEQNGALGPDDRSRRSLPATREPSRRRSPPRRLRVARSRVAPLDFSRRRRQRLTGAPRLPRDRRKPSSPRPSSPSRRLTPMSTPSCRRRSSGRCASRLPRARTRRAAARSTRCRRFTRPIALISRLSFH